MKLSNLIALANELKDEFGDVEIFDEANYLISGIEIRKASMNEREFWGLPPYFALINNSE